MKKFKLALLAALVVAAFGAFDASAVGDTTIDCEAQPTLCARVGPVEVFGHPKIVVPNEK